MEGLAGCILVGFITWASRQPVLDILRVPTFAPWFGGEPVGPEPGSCGRKIAYVLEIGFLGLIVQGATSSQLSGQGPVDFMIDVDAFVADMFLELLALPSDEPFHQFV